ncbi:hypothetical protein ABV409_15530 [Flagellimonas sp. DF-77]|uniref:O-antigen ligase family protein n=1 Tax=Flagellimonas algarum TaxID=3230298 RepID=UPI0033915FF6
MTVKTYLSTVGYPLVILLVLHFLNPFDLGFIFAYLLVVFCALIKKKQLIRDLDLDFLLLLCFGACYSIFDALNGHSTFQYMVMRAIFPAFFYILGKQLIVKGLTTKHIILVVLALVVLFSTTTILSIGKDLLKGGFAQISRTIPDFWTGQGIKATKYSSYLVYAMGLPAVLISISKLYHRKTIWALTAFFFVALLCVFRLGSRTAISIAVITFLFGLGTLFMQQNAKDNIRLIAFLGLFTFLMLKFSPLNLESEVFSTLGHRLQAKGTSSNESAGGRTELWASAIENMGKNPLGWKSKRHAHNLWLDIAKFAGIIPVIFLVLFNIRNFNNHLRLIRLDRTRYPNGIKIMFSLFTLGAVTSFFVEPIFQGNLFAFTFFCLLQGTLSAFLERSSTNNHNKEP